MIGQTQYIASILRDEVNQYRSLGNVFQHINPDYAQSCYEYADANEQGAIMLAEMTPREFSAWYFITVEGYSFQDYLFAVQNGMVK